MGKDIVRIVRWITFIPVFVIVYLLIVILLDIAYVYDHPDVPFTKTGFIFEVFYYASINAMGMGFSMYRAIKIAPILRIGYFTTHAIALCWIFFSLYTIISTPDSRYFVIYIAGLVGVAIGVVLTNVALIFTRWDNLNGSISKLRQLLYSKSL